MSERTVSVTPEIADDVLDRLREAMPEDWWIMPIGGTELAYSDEGAPRTKDVDVVIVTLEADGARIPGYEELVAFAHELSDAVGVRKDHTSVNLTLDTQAGPVRVEFVRGRTPGSGGYFVTRSVLETAATLAEERDGMLRLPIEAMAFLKAWAAHDKAKLVEAGKDRRGYHKNRQEAFLDDVQRLRETLGDRGGKPDHSVFERLFAATGGEREQAVEEILEAREWLGA